MSSNDAQPDCHMCPPTAELGTRVEKEEILPLGIISIVRGSLDLRNDMSHPLTVALWKPAHTALLLQTAHRLHSVLSRRAR